MTALAASNARLFTADGSASLPLHADRELAWDSAAADKAIRAWASSDGSGAPDKMDWAKYASVHFWHDPALATDFGGYKLLFADVFGGKPEAVWKGVAAVAAALQGSRGGVNIPAAEVDAVKGHVATYYQRFAKLFKDDQIVPPWEQAAIERVASGGTAALLATDVAATPAPEVPVGGVLLVEGSVTEDGRLIQAGAADWRELPLPLYASLLNLPGHDSANLVGRIDQIWRDKASPEVINWSGVIVPGAADGAGQETIDAIRDKLLRGISIDGIVGPGESFIDDNEVNVMSRIVVAGGTLTPMPAIQDATVTLLATSTEAFGMDEETNVDEAVDGAPVVAPDQTAAADQLTAISDQVAAVADRVEFLIGLIEQSQMSARYEAASAKVSARP